jgi:hypothetical protein
MSDSKTETGIDILSLTSHGHISHCFGPSLDRVISQERVRLTCALLVRVGGEGGECRVERVRKMGRKRRIEMNG